ncbi:MAG: two-component system response regulator [Acidobacteria bacterium]|nr:MAG: two-component system response regulator [Acidobacteria bacterium 13_1_40CM_4_58_4]PYT60355.1 MAG: two-component system response regulator [Acidobacteriota bacterium]
MDDETILVVDDEEAIREVVSTMLESKGYRCAVAHNGRAAQEQIKRDTPDLVLSDMIMPEMDGIKLLEWVRQYDPDVPVIMVTAIHDISTALEAIRRGAYDYILKPFEKDQLFLGVNRALQHRRLVNENRKYQRDLEQQVRDRTARLQEALDQLEQSYDDTLEALGGALDLKDEETEGHCQRVTAFCISIAKMVPVPDGYLPIMARAAFLHDIGKMAIPDGILRKPGPLTDDEKRVMRTHCEIGYNMLIRIPFLRDAAEIVLAHQEFYDGSGYPRGLKGEEIPLGARIFAVADSLDAMVSDRPYRRKLPMAHACEEIKRCSGSQFDPEVVKVFLSIPEQHWLDLRENLGSPFRLAHLKNL